MTEFTRGFRLHTEDGDAYDGAQFPSSRVYVLDHPEHGLATAATSMEYLLERFPAGTRVEWADEMPSDDGALRQAIAAAITSEHYRRAGARIVASPEEHSAGMADVVMPVVAAHMAPRVGDGAGVQGRCPACHGQSLFLAAGGYVTCRRLACSDPEAAANLLEASR